MAWSQAEIDRVADLRERGGLTIARIAELIGRPAATVQSMCVREGIEPPVLRRQGRAATPYRRAAGVVKPFSPAEDERLQAVASAGQSYVALARALARHPGVVRQRLITLARQQERADA